MECFTNHFFDYGDSLGCFTTRIIKSRCKLYYEMKKVDGSIIIANIDALIKNPKMINVEDENGKSIHDEENEKNRVFLRGIEVGLSIAKDMVKNS